MLSKYTTVTNECVTYFFSELREVISKSSADLLGKDHIKEV